MRFGSLVKKAKVIYARRGGSAAAKGNAQ